MVMMTLYARQQNDTDVYHGLLDSVGEGEGGMTGEDGIEICILSRKKRIASLGSMHDTGCMGLVHRDDPEGWYREGSSSWGTRVYLCIPVADSC